MGFLDERKKRKEEEQKREDAFRSNKLDSKLFLDYLKEWQEWGETGKEPKYADNDLRYSLSLQENRLKKHGLAKKVKIDIEEGPIDLAKIDFGKPLNGMHMIAGKSETSYIKKGSSEVIGKRKKYISFYETIVKAPDDHEGVAKRNYSCPNCGSVSKVSELIDGCPYCNTKFTMGELYPKVHNSYILDGMPQGKSFNIEMLKTMIPVGVIVAIVFVVKNLKDVLSGESSPVWFFSETIITGVIAGVILGYFLFAIRMLGTLFYEGAKVIPLLFGATGGKKKVNKMSIDYFPNLNYEYFEGKALSLLRCVLFSDDPTEFVQYSGGPLSETYKNIVDVSYRGGMGVKEVKEVEADGKEKIQVSLRIFLENAKFDGEKVRLSREVANMTMVHDRHSRVDTGFTITAVTCRSCGGSFNAARERRCAFCNTPFNAEVDDWIVTELKIE